MFSCPNCGYENYIDDEPKNVEGRVYRCKKCKAKVLLDKLIQPPKQEKFNFGAAS